MKVTVDQIDALLPQTQCNLCDYAGCRPYAEAILYKNEAVDKCLPGGVEVLVSLGQLMGQDPQPLLAEMKKKAKPPTLAVIDETACIGCKKCIRVCPVDAILGAPKQMHTVIASECTGCDLCIPVCPVDCIEIVPTQEMTSAEKKEKAKLAKSRYEFKQVRLQREKMEMAEEHRQMKFANLSDRQEKVLARKQAIQEAVARVKRQKNEC